MSSLFHAASASAGSWQAGGSSAIALRGYVLRTRRANAEKKRSTKFARSRRTKKMAEGSRGGHGIAVQRQPRSYRRSEGGCVWLEKCKEARAKGEGRSALWRSALWRCVKESLGHPRSRGLSRGRAPRHPRRTWLTRGRRVGRRGYIPFIHTVSLAAPGLNTPPSPTDS